MAKEIDWVYLGTLERPEPSELRRKEGIWISDLKYALGKGIRIKQGPSSYMHHACFYVPKGKLKEARKRIRAAFGTIF